MSGAVSVGFLGCLVNGSVNGSISGVVTGAVIWCGDWCGDWCRDWCSDWCMAVSFAGEVANVVAATPGVLLLLTCAAAGSVLVLLLRWLGDACWVHRLPLEWQVVDLLKVFPLLLVFWNCYLCCALLLICLPPTRSWPVMGDSETASAVFSYPTNGTKHVARSQDRTHLRRRFGLQFTRRQSCTARHLVEDNSG